MLSTVASLNSPKLWFLVREIDIYGRIAVVLNFVSTMSWGFILELNFPGEHKGKIMKWAASITYRRKHYSLPMLEEPAILHWADPHR